MQQNHHVRFFWGTSILSFQWEILWMGVTSNWNRQ